MIPKSHGYEPKRGDTLEGVNLCMIDGYEHQHERFKHCEFEAS